MFATNGRDDRNVRTYNACEGCHLPKIIYGDLDYSLTVARPNGQNEPCQGTTPLALGTVAHVFSKCGNDGACGGRLPERAYHGDYTRLPHRCPSI